jgi:glycosyltransferase involved in cell wall biosynthesis
MRIAFHEPPAEQRIGGLDAAIRGLQAALEKHGHKVAINPNGDFGRPDVVHFHGLWQPQFARRARHYLQEKVPYIVSPHGMLEPWAWNHKRWKKYPYWHLIEKRWVRHAARLLATADSEALRLETFLPQARCAVLPLGLTGNAQPNYAAAREKLGWEPGEMILLFLSRVHEKKGLDLLLSALADLGKGRPARLRLVIVGPEEQPGYAERCRRFIKLYAGRLPAIEWKGPVWGDERWAYLQGADLFCLPTHSENFGLVVLESCQVGTPVLTTTGTPWTDVLPDRAGFIAEPNVDSISSQLSAFFHVHRPEPTDREELANWARENYDWEQVAARYAELYGHV